MCGNFGLLYLHNENNNDNSNKNKNNNHDNYNQASADDKLMMNSSYKSYDIPQHNSNEVIVAQIFEGNINNNINSKTIILKKPLLILQHQAANTEIRGGQAGGYSSFEYTKCHNSKATPYEAEYNQIPDITRIRAVARKRVPLAGDLTAKYLHARKGRRMGFDKTFTGEVQHRLSLCLSLLITYLLIYCNQCYFHCYYR
jgi:hypothetical protein